jgi:hypothetical protein
MGKIAGRTGKVRMEALFVKAALVSSARLLLLLASDGGLPILASMGKDLLEHCKTYTNRVRTENERQRIVL